MALHPAPTIAAAADMDIEPTRFLLQPLVFTETVSPGRNPRPESVRDSYLHTKLLASSVLPLPRYVATCG